MLTDEQSKTLTPDARSDTFTYEVVTPFNEDVDRSAEATVTIQVPPTTPEADQVFAVAEESDRVIGGFPGTRPAYEVNFNVVNGPDAIDGDELKTRIPENAGGNEADLGAVDRADSDITPVFEILSLPTFGALYIDLDPNSTLDTWKEEKIGDTFTSEDNTFTPEENLRWVIELGGERGVVGAVTTGAQETSFTYRAAFSGIESEIETVTIDISDLVLPDPSLADDVLTAAVQISDPDSELIPPGFPVGSDTDPVTQLRVFNLNGELDGTAREDAPTLGGQSQNDVPLSELTFVITTVPPVGTLVVERLNGSGSDFFEVGQGGFQLSSADTLYWVATASEANDLPPSGQVFFNYTVRDGFGAPSDPAVVQVDVFQADPVRTFIDDVPECEPACKIDPCIGVIGVQK